MPITLRLIHLYSFLEDCYNRELEQECQRFSPNQYQEFTDVEILTCYFWGILEDEKFKIKSIHSHISKYWLDWFPSLPSYVAFNTRLNRLSGVLPHLLNLVLQEFASSTSIDKDYLIDSFPIMLCKHKMGKVAPELADKTYSASKKLYYYGIKLHCLGIRQEDKMPLPNYVTFTQASCHDSTPFKQILSHFNYCSIFGDKAYFGKEMTQILNKQHCQLLHPIKKIKGEGQLNTYINQAHKNLWGKAVSTIRQPIECLFNWIIDKTDIQNASKVRSTKGLLVHAYGKIIAACLLTFGF